MPTKTTKGVQPAVNATLANLPELLRALLAPDNDVRDKAEATLKVLGKDPQIVPALLTHVRNDTDPQVRQLSAVVLKRRILGQWAKLSRETHEQVKSVLLDGIVKEPLGIVRRSIADVVSKVAKVSDDRRRGRRKTPRAHKRTSTSTPQRSDGSSRKSTC